MAQRHVSFVEEQRDVYGVIAMRVSLSAKLQHSRHALTGRLKVADKLGENKVGVLRPSEDHGGDVALGVEEWISVGNSSAHALRASDRSVRRLVARSFIAAPTLVRAAY
jgi:hypothetical protein